MKKLLKATGFTALMAGIYFFVSIIVGIGLGIVLMIKVMLSGDNIQMNNIENLVTQGLSDWMVVMIVLINLITLGCVILFFLARKDRFISYVRFKKFRISDAVLIGILGVFFNVLIVGLVTASNQIFPIQEQMKVYQQLMEPLLNGPILLVFLVVSVSAPLFEEIIFRGIVLNDFKKAVPVWLAVGIQAVLFGVFHMNWIQGVYATLLGIVLGVIYLKYRTIFAPMLMHFTYNSASFIYDSVLNEDTGLMVLIMTGLIGSLLFIGLLYKNYKPSYYAIEIEEGIENLEGIENPVGIENLVKIQNSVGIENLVKIQNSAEEVEVETVVSEDI